MKTIIIFGCGCVVWTTCTLAGAAQNRTGGAVAGAAGRIVGRAQVRGTPVPATQINIDSECAKIVARGLDGETVVADGTGGLRNAFVYVKEVLDPALNLEPPVDPVVLTQRGCRFEPRVLGVSFTFATR